MYKMKPIYDDLSVNMGSCSSELEARQDKCLGDLDMLIQRAEKLQAECCGSKSVSSTQKLDLVIGCSVGSPAVYMTAIMARKSNCLIKVFSHSSNKKEVDNTVTDKLQRINHNESEYCGINLIYKDVSAPYFMAAPGRQIAVSGVSNILRFLCRQQGYSSLYNEEQLETAALLDEILSLVDSLEQRIHGSSTSDVGQLLNQVSGCLKSNSYLTGESISIADIALCSCLAAMDTNTIPNSLKSYLTNCVKSNYELKVLKAFLPDWGKQ